MVSMPLPDDLLPDRGEAIDVDSMCGHLVDLDVCGWAIDEGTICYAQLSWAIRSALRWYVDVG